MEALTVLASLTGFLAAQFVAGLYAEQFADVYLDAYDQGFYIAGAAPTVTSPVMLTESEKAIIAKYCELPANQSLDTGAPTTPPAGG